MDNKLIAGASFDQNFFCIKEGKAKTRYSLLEGDDRFSIALASIKEGGAWQKVNEGVLLLSGRYVKILNDDGSHLLLNISSAASRLHLTQDEVKAIAKGDNAIEKLREQAHKVKTIFEEVRDLIGDSYDNEKSKEGIEKARTIIKASKEDGSGQVNIESLKKIKKGISSSQLEGRILYIRDKKGRGGLLEIIRKLGQGGFGTVYAVRDLAKKDSTPEALKLASAEPMISEAAQRDLKNEYEVLKTLHGKGECLGIMKVPRKMINLSEDDALDNQRVGYLGYRYESDYSSHLSIGVQFSPPTSKNDVGKKFFEFYQLLSGLAKLQKNGFIHGDLKPENIYCEKKEGESRVYIGDFGSAAREAADSDTLSFSPSYCSSADLDERFKLARNMEGNAKKLKELDLKRDVFAMGVILYQSLTGELPYPVKEVGGILMQGKRSTVKYIARVFLQS